MPASMHIRNARIWTGDPKRPSAAGMSIENGRVASLDAASPAIGSVEMDSRGRVIVPGLIDSHMHMLMGGMSLAEVDLSGVRSRAAFEKAIADAHSRLPGGQWLIARGWNEANWPGHQLPDKSWLRGAGGAAGRPCVCHRMDIHASLVNEPVLAMCDAANRADPAGGRIVRDPATGAPTGLMQEAAAWELVNPLIPSLDACAKRERLLAAQAHAHALGLTAVGSMEFARDVREVFQPLRDDDRALTLRVRATLQDRDGGPDDWREFIRFARDFPHDDRLAVIGCKAFIDGTLGSRTARMLADYADDAGGTGNRGMLVELPASGHLREWVRAVASERLSPSMHAIGDEANRIALDVLAAVDEIDRTTRHDSRARVEHVQHIDLADLPRWRGRIASMQPLHKAADANVIVERLGSARARGAYAFRDLADAGAILAFGSDWPVVSCDPVLGMRAAITGLTFDDKPFAIEQNLDVEQTLRAYTRDAAYCLRLDDAGVLREGMLGDCVMFDIDPFTADWIRRPPRVIMTIVGGEVVFDAT